MLNESVKDISTMCFHVIFQAIMDSFGLETMTPDAKGGLAGKRLLERCKEEATHFVMSSDFDTFCNLAAIHHKVPSPVKVRERLATLKQTGEIMDLSALIVAGRN